MDFENFGDVFTCCTPHLFNPATSEKITTLDDSAKRIMAALKIWQGKSGLVSQVWLLKSGVFTCAVLNNKKKNPDPALGAPKKWSRLTTVSSLRAASMPNAMAEERRGSSKCPVAKILQKTRMQFALRFLWAGKRFHYDNSQFCSRTTSHEAFLFFSYLWLSNGSGIRRNSSLGKSRRFHASPRPAITRWPWAAMMMLQWISKGPKTSLAGQDAKKLIEYIPIASEFCQIDQPLFLWDKKITRENKITKPFVLHHLSLLMRMEG